MTLRKRPRSGTGSPKVLFGEDKASSRPLISGAARNAVYGPGGAAPAALTAEYLVIAGGGGGASAYGGGGAGGYRTAADFSLSLGTAYTVTVGAGAPADAAGGPLGSQGSDGSDSTFDAITSTGGGGGSSYDSATPGPLADGRDGGSGGGGGYTPAGSSGGAGNTPATTPSQGNDGGGGSQSAPYYGAGGGGGAGTVGANGTSTNGGAGGAGLSSVITGSSVFRAGGGGGGNYSAANGGTGGIGGGGNAGSPGVAGAAGTANTGGGGGGGHAGAAGVGAWTGGGAGGSGVVIIRVPSTVVAEFSAGVVYNYIPTDDFNVYEITAAGVSDTVTFSQGAVTTVGESLRFNDNDFAYLTRTPASAGDRQKFTWSGWIKRSNLNGSGGIMQLFDVNSGGTNECGIRFSSDAINAYDYAGGSFQWRKAAYNLLRDPSAWYHIHLEFDSTRTEAAQRAKLYVNGIEVDYQYVVDPVLNYQGNINTANPHYLGKWTGGSTRNFDGYMADVHFIDGQALDPSRFGKKDADGIWQPITYTGSYGTNGFHLDFADNSTAAALGTDTSGNGNNWTPSGITTDDQVTDTPSVNYATWNGLDTGNLLADGNLQILAFGTSGWKFTRGTFAIPSGKWYWEASNAGANIQVGISERTTSLTTYFGQGAASFGYYNADGYLYRDNFYYAFGDTWGSGDVIGIAFDADTRELTFYKNNVSQGSYTVPEAEYFPAAAAFNSSVTHNFGQRPFAYTPPTGFQALSSSNLAAPTITDGKAHFQPAVYTGNGTTQSIGGLEFQPDFVWIKSRTTVNNHILSDAVRGAGAVLVSDDPQAEVSLPTDFQSFDASGFTVGYAGFNFTNGSGQNYVAWSWNAGGSTVANTDGTIPSQVRANTTAGFSIVTYNPSFSSGQSGTIGHGLSAAPQIVITKRRDITGDWWTFVEGATGRQDDYLALNLTNAVSNAFPPAGRMTATTFTDSYDYANASNSMVAYCFHSVDGFSKFGSYTGNGSTDGPFVYTGFRPAFVLVKQTDVSGNFWLLEDSTRSPFNAVDDGLFPNNPNVEAVLNATDFLSNGFKIRSSGSNHNTNGSNYIYMAFAENPFKTARAR